MLSNPSRSFCSRFLIALVALFAASTVRAEIAKNIVVEKNYAGQVLSVEDIVWDRSSSSADPVLIADQFLTRNLEIYGLTDLSELVPSAPRTDELGMKHVKYFQYRDGLPVLGAELIVHISAQGSVKSVTGNVSAQAANLGRIAPSKIMDKLADTAIVSWKKDNSTSDEPVIEKIQRVLIDEKLLNPNATKAPYTALEVTLVPAKGSELPEGPSGEILYIAESSAAVTKTLSLERHFTREVWDCSRYANWGGCVLNRFSSQYNYFFGRSEGAAVRGPNPIYQTSDVDNLYDTLQVVDNYWLTRHARNGANKLGGTGPGGTGGYPTNVTRGFTYLDPVWGSTCPNANWGTNKAMNFCNGMTTTDVTNHEYTHGVYWYSFTDTNGAPWGTTYYGETASIEEGSSDYYGEAAEYFRSGSNDWLAGTGASSGIVRSLSNPPSLTRPNDGLPYPDRFYADSFYCGTDDFGGAHYNATVLGKGLYLMTMGGKFNGCAVRGIGRDKVEKVLYRAINNYFPRSVTYNQAYSSMKLACRDLYDFIDCNEVSNALLAVEMNQGGKCSGIARSKVHCPYCFKRNSTYLCLYSAIAKEWP